ncbi:MAG: poly-beta-1,6-N-acetyl-D-glucosamine biosynthesis protein PgaD [Proteobacteria bacterium]|nr:poly-beta-1,6-N-acetyl-D-glucosamine biosynthesis protein PgaD [Pseudomonadota bacterium]
MNPLIIKRPKLQTLKQKYANTIVTLAFWALWFYLWIPLISLVAWLFGIEIFYEEFILTEGYHLLISLFFRYGMVTLIISICLLGWAFYNQLRFRNKDRRKEAPLPSSQALADFFGVNVAHLEKSRKAKRLIVRFDDTGQIRNIEILDH